jgi:hypothetical protein
MTLTSARQMQHAENHPFLAAAGASPSRWICPGNIPEVEKLIQTFLERYSQEPGLDLLGEHLAELTATNIIDACDEFLRFHFARCLVTVIQSPSRPMRRAALQLIAKLSARPGSSFVLQLFDSDIIDVVFALCRRHPRSALPVKCLCNLASNYPMKSFLMYDPTFLDMFMSLVMSESTDSMARKWSAQVIAAIARPEMPPSSQMSILRFTKSLLSDLATEPLWVVLARIPGSLITDLESSNYILDGLGFFSYFISLLESDSEVMQEIAILTIGRHFLFSDAPVPLDYAKIIGFAWSPNDSLSSAAMWMISNLISRHLLPILADIGLFEIIRYVCDSGCARARFEASAAAAAIVRVGNREHHVRCIKENYMAIFIAIIETEDTKMTKLALPAVIKLLRLTDMELRDIAMNQFFECEGQDIISRVAESNNPTAANSASLFCQFLPRLFDS